MRFAIVGSGISGLVTAYLLSSEHEVTVFEANDYAGGHTHTVEVEVDGRTHPVDTGFIVFNEENYPYFTLLLDQLRVSSKPSNMSFSVHCEQTGLEYNGTSLNGLFAQRRNLLSPRFYRMIRDIIRFYRESVQLLDTGDRDLTLGDYLHQNRYSTEFVEYHILPMGSAIWSSGSEQIQNFPARHFVEFFHNHGFLRLRNRPAWRTIEGGSSQYVERLIIGFRDRIRLKCPVVSITRRPDSVEITCSNGEIEKFDHVVIATHSDQALGLLTDAHPRETEILSQIKYNSNETVLHSDSSLLPLSRRAWASWNYYIRRDQPDHPIVTYYMNSLQDIHSSVHFCVTLNSTDSVEPDLIIKRMTYHHPVYNPRAVRAQQRWAEISGRNRTHFCGAYWGYGFHEDGVRSALRVCETFGRRL